MAGRILLGLVGSVIILVIVFAVSAVFIAPFAHAMLASPITSPSNSDNPFSWITPIEKFYDGIFYWMMDSMGTRVT